MRVSTSSAKPNAEQRQAIRRFAMGSLFGILLLLPLIGEPKDLSVFFAGIIAYASLYLLGVFLSTRTRRALFFALYFALVQGILVISFMAVGFYLMNKLLAEESWTWPVLALLISAFVFCWGYYDAHSRLRTHNYVTPALDRSRRVWDLTKPLYSVEQNNESWSMLAKWIVVFSPLFAQWLIQTQGLFVAQSVLVLGCFAMACLFLVVSPQSLIKLDLILRIERSDAAILLVPGE